MRMNFYYNSLLHSDDSLTHIRVFNEYDLHEKFQIFWGEKKVESPIKAEILLPSSYDDIAYFENDIANFGISDRFKALLLQNNITGWNTYGLDLNNTNFIYHGFIVTGKCGDLIRPLSKGWVNGYNFDINSWDGSDFFHPPGFGSYFVTGRIKEIIKKHKLKGIDFVNINDIKWYSSGGVFRKTQER